MGFKMKIKANMVTRTLGVLVLSSISLTLPAHAAKPAWDQEANLKDAATRLAALQRRSGASGVLKFLDACYRTHLLASNFTQGLEACMAQDYMHSEVLAAIYAKLPAEARARPDVLKPEAIARAMNDRFVTIFAQYKISAKDSDAFKRAVEKHGFPIFLQAVFPKAGDANTSRP